MYASHGLLFSVIFSVQQNRYNLYGIVYTGTYLESDMCIYTTNPKQCENFTASTPLFIIIITWDLLRGTLRGLAFIYNSRNSVPHKQLHAYI